VKNLKLLAVYVILLSSTASGSQSLTVNNQVVDTITLQLGQSCTIEICSDNNRSYAACIGFDDAVLCGSFVFLQTMDEAGDLADVLEYNVEGFSGYYVRSGGLAVRPSPGAHFVFEFEAQMAGEAFLMLYDETLMSVISSVHITVVRESTGTAFTYQGRLLDGGGVADDLYDFRFELYDAPTTGTQLGRIIDVEGLDVIDGYFTVELDFGEGVFDGGGRWLEISVRPGQSNDPEDYTTLSPRQRIMPTPYALHAFSHQAEKIISGSYAVEQLSIGALSDQIVATINFGHTFASPPVVLITGTNGEGSVTFLVPHVADVSTTDFTILLSNPSSEVCSRAYSFNWVAIGDSGTTTMVTWYKDSDGDGYSDGTTQSGEGYPPVGYYLASELLATSGDCDDTDPSTYPGATEVLDGKDNDCDGLIDEDLGVDADGDGYPVPEDCDDTDPAVHPGAEEVLDGKDNDCDGLIDEDLGVDADGDGYPVPEDCDDTDPAVHPGAEEVLDGKDNDCDGLIDEGLGIDADGDGYAIPEDCDDTDPSIHPGAVEVCDGKDNDCDGRIDENASDCITYYRDFDGDGYGSPNVRCLCSPSDLYTATHGGDCDDTDSAVHPGATEICDGKDNDCDGTVDEEGASGCTTYYRDNDADGYGQSGDSKCLCSPSGMYGVTIGGDCDDGDSTVYPGATEVCDGKDNDCDGTVDEEGASGCTTYYIDKDNDGYGWMGDSGKCLCSPSGMYTATNNNDCDDMDCNVNPGAEEVCGDGIDNDCDGIVDEGCCPDADADGYDTCDPGEPGDMDGRPADCDDGDPTVYPGAPEVCDGKDNDCDGEVDEEGASGCTTYYIDMDNDSYGWMGDSGKCLCSPSGMYTATNNWDCDDTDSTIYPGAEEICDDGIDQDCDGEDCTCDDGNACTDDMYVVGVGCVNVNKPNGTPCDDGDPLTFYDVCTDGVCAGVHDGAASDLYRDNDIDFDDLIRLADYWLYR